MVKYYPIEKIDKTEDILYYPKELNFPQIKTICFGSLSTDGVAISHRTNKKRISISQSLWEKLHIPDIPLKLHLFEKDGVLLIGPIVGIFTAGFTSFPHSILGDRTYFFSKILSIHDKVGVLPIVFGIQHLDLENGLVNGYFYQNNEWKQIKVPIPNVIYDRLPNRKIERLTKIQDFKSKMASDYLIPWYNPGFFNKLDVYSKLRRSLTTKSYIPAYNQFSKENLENMLDNYHHLYMKPNHGSLGNGVVQIKKVNDSYICRFRDEKEQNRLFSFNSFQSLYKYLNNIKKDTEYILQQGISLMKMNKANADFRVHTNKGIDGKWYVSAIGCKIGAFGSATTHVLSGGSIQTYEEIFPEELDRKEKLAKLMETTILLSEELERYYDGMLAEIGFDIGMDTEGNLWLFEANSKPGRAIFRHPKLRKYERLTQKLVLSYSIHLTEKVLKEPEKLFHDFILQ